METVLTIFHVLLCLFLIVVVLLQSSRGAEIGAAFGGASRTLFGASGATTVMGKITTVVAIFFMVTCLALTYYSEKPKVTSVMDKPKQGEVAPLLPEAKPVQGVENQKQGSETADVKESQPMSQSSPAPTPGGEGEKK